MPGRQRGRARDFIRLLSFFGLIAFAIVWLEQPNQETLTGRFNVVDGDSLNLGDQRIRLVGIDAPELSQKCARQDGAIYDCGDLARAYLGSLIWGNSDVRCLTEGRDRYDRYLAECFGGDTNINRSMVAAGWAISYGRYHDAEAEAVDNQLGLWAGPFDRPQVWRTRHGGLVEAEHQLFWDRFWRPIWRWFSGGDDL